MIIAQGQSSGGGTPTPFGFELPTGDPGEIDAAASACARWSAALGDRAASLRQGAAEAQGAWSGQAESQFASFAAHLVGVSQSTSEAVAEAGRLLSAFAAELSAAQQATERAYGECESAQSEYTTQSEAASTYGQSVQSLSTRLAAATTPHESAVLGSQLTAAQGNQTDAQQAATRAQTALENAQRQGQQAWNTYLERAQSTARALQAVGSSLQKVQAVPHGSAFAPQRSTSSGAAPGFWPLFDEAASSPLTGGTLGLAEAVADRYRVSDLVLPITARAGKTLEGWSEQFGDTSDPFTRSASGVWVPKGTYGDPLLEEVESATRGPEYSTPGEPFLVPDAGDLEGAAPGLARAAGTGLFVVGAGLTLYSTAEGQWSYDEQHEKGWSTAAKVADTAQTTAVVGGLSVGGAYVTAEAVGTAGAEGGAAVGTLICPGVGTVVGGVIGGVGGAVVGGIAGSELGKAAGHALEGAGHWAAHEASSLWHDVF